MGEQRGTVLIADDEEDVRRLVKALLEKEGIRTVEARDGREALERVVREAPDVALVDIRMPEIDGLAVLKRARELMPDMPVVVITAFADIAGAIEAVRAGAHEYLAKPFDNAKLLKIVQRAQADHVMKRLLRERQDTRLLVAMGPSPPIQRLVADVNRVATSDFSVVVCGETGSGKELVARALHVESPRAGGPFVPVDCGAIPDTLLESELFGHDKGAFTGAIAQKPGKFEVARSGTLFLDEVSNMPLVAQAKLLRVLQDKVVSRVGSTRPFKVDVRLVVATNRDLGAAVAEGSFRQDLFFRLAEFTIRVPPLRERREDICYLAQRFAALTSLELGRRRPELCDETLETLISFPWPGNVRQLRATIRRAVLLAGDEVRPEHLDVVRTGPASGAVAIDSGLHIHSLRQTVRESTVIVERQAVVEALRLAQGNKAQAARLLHVDYKTIHSKIKEYGIAFEREKSNGHEEGN